MRFPIRLAKLQVAYLPRASAEAGAGASTSGMVGLNPWCCVEPDILVLAGCFLLYIHSSEVWKVQNMLRTNLFIITFHMNQPWGNIIARGTCTMYTMFCVVMSMAKSIMNMYNYIVCQLLYQQKHYSVAKNGLYESILGLVSQWENQTHEKAAANTFEIHRSINTYISLVLEGKHASWRRWTDCIWWCVWVKNCYIPDLNLQH